MRLLALDLATTTGWALFEGGAPTSYGQVCGALDSDAPPPFDILQKAVCAATQAKLLVERHAPDRIAVEDTNIGGRAGRSSQRFLEWLHCCLLGSLDFDRSKVHYLTSSQWRKAIGLGLTPQDRANNKLLAVVRSKLKRQLQRKPTPAELAAAKALHGIGGKRTIKHASVDWANARYGLNLKKTHSDAADALCLGSAFIILNPQ